jgi:hypothetical protein
MFLTRKHGGEDVVPGRRSISNVLVDVPDQSPPYKRKHLDIPQIIILAPIPHTHIVHVVLFGQGGDCLLYRVLPSANYLVVVL